MKTSVLSKQSHLETWAAGMLRYVGNRRSWCNSKAKRHPAVCYSTLSNLPYKRLSDFDHLYTQQLTVSVCSGVPSRRSDLARKRLILPLRLEIQQPARLLISHAQARHNLLISKRHPIQGLLRVPFFLYWRAARTWPISDGDT